MEYTKVPLVIDVFTSQLIFKIHRYMSWMSLAHTIYYDNTKIKRFYHKIDCYCIITVLIKCFKCRLYVRNNIVDITFYKLTTVKR